MKKTLLIIVLAVVLTYLSTFIVHPFTGMLQEVDSGESQYIQTYYGFPWHLNCTARLNPNFSAEQRVEYSDGGCGLYNAVPGLVINFILYLIVSFFIVGIVYRIRQKRHRT